MRFISANLILLTSVLSLAGCGGGTSVPNGSGSAAIDAASSPPSVTFSAQPDLVYSGESATLQWRTSGATSCNGSGGWSGSKGTSGTTTVGPLSSTTTFSLSCSGEGGATLKELTVEVTDDDRVRVALSVDRELVLANDQVEISWNSVNATSCEASGAWSGDKPLSGTATSQPIAADANFKLTCFKTGASGSASVFVTVADRIVEWQAPKKNVDGTPIKGLDGFNLYWGAKSRSYDGSVRLASKARSWEADLPAGTYYFAITAIDKQGAESGYSNEIIKRLP